MRPNDALSRTIERVNLVELLNTHCPTPETLRLNPEHGGLIRDPCPGFEEQRPSFSVSRCGGVWLWHRFGRADDRGREEGGNAYHLLVRLGFSPREAVEELERFVGFSGIPSPVPRVRSIAQQAAVQTEIDDLLEVLKRAQGNLKRHWPVAALEARGITLELSQRCDLGWQHDGSLFIPIFGPTGCLLRIKQRLAERSGAGRYRYLGMGGGAPAWCNPGYGQASSVLLCEGELNGLVAWGAAQAIGLELDLQGLAGAGGSPHSDGLGHRRVFVYADADESGRKAVKRWSNLACESGALEVFRLKPLPGPFDFCDLAGRDGPEALGEYLCNQIGESQSSSDKLDSAPTSDSAPSPGEENRPSSTIPFVSRQRNPRACPRPCSNS